MNVCALDPLTSLHLELGRTVEPSDIVHGFLEGDTHRREQCLRVLAECNTDLVLARLEGTLMEKLELQDDVYSRLTELLEEERLASLAWNVLIGSTSPQARRIVENRRDAWRQARVS